MNSEYNEQIIKKIQKTINNSDSKDRICFLRYYSSFNITEIIDQIITNKINKTSKVLEYEFVEHEMQDAYNPFLKWIKELYFEYYSSIPLNQFLDDCQVYKLQKSMFISYIENGRCKREENIIRREVKYEQFRLIRSLINIFHKVSLEHNLVLVLSKLHISQKSTIKLLIELIKESKENQISIIGSYNDSYGINSYMKNTWDEFQKVSNEYSFAVDCCVDYIDNNDNQSKELIDIFEAEATCIDEYLCKLNNMLYCLTLDQAKYYIDIIYHYSENEKLQMQPKNRISFLLIYVMVCIYTMEIKQAYIISKKINDTDYIYKDIESQYYYNYVDVLVKLYSGHIKEAESTLESTRLLARTMEDSRKMLDADMLSIMVLLRGCEEIFLWDHTTEIPDTILENAKKNNQINHLAYAYLFGFIGREINSCRDENLERVVSLDNSEYFKKGIKFAASIDNNDAQVLAWRKNGVVASVFGLFDEIIYSYNKSLEYKENYDRRQDEAQIYNGIGYCSIICERYDLANQNLKISIDLALELGKPDLILESIYNIAINQISYSDFKSVIKNISLCLDIMNMLGLHRIKVCNTAKMYGMLIFSYLQTNRVYDAKLYFEKMKLALDHIISDPNPNYDMWEDDIFLFYVADGMIKVNEGMYEQAEESYRQARFIWNQAHSKQEYIYTKFIEQEARLYKLLGKENSRTECLISGIAFCKKNNYIKNETILQNILYNQKNDIVRYKNPLVEKKITEIMRFIDNYSLRMELLRKNKILGFFENWVELLNREFNSSDDIVENALLMLKNTFNLDEIIYINKSSSNKLIRYKNNDREFSEFQAKCVVEYMKKYRKKVIVSRFDNSYLFHEELVSIFVPKNIASMMVIPFVFNDKLTGIFIANRLKHANYTEKIEMFTVDDFNIYRTAFRELMEAENKFYIKKQIEKNSITDILTQLLNRQGMKKYIEDQFSVNSSRKKTARKEFAILYIDLDNFKYCNDNFGHDIGDCVLVAFSNMLKNNVDGESAIIRYGGDEFVVIIPNANGNVAIELAKRIFSNIDKNHGFKNTIETNYKKKIEIEKKNQITCSIGISTGKTASAAGISRILKKADNALYKVKRTTKHDYLVWDE